MPVAGERRHLLLLAGTAEARQLREALRERPDLHVTTTLAGVTETPAVAAEHRGGFGGKEGLEQFLQERSIDLLVDATHPFAGQITRNAHAAAENAGCDYLRVERPPWAPVTGDRWVIDSGALGWRWFAAIGERGFRQLKPEPECFYLVRSISPPREPLPVNVQWIVARPPFSLADEIALMTSRRIDGLVARNSGGAEGYAKIEAARRLGLPVLMLQRPSVSASPMVSSVSAALDWVDGWRGRSTCVWAGS